LLKIAEGKKSNCRVFEKSAVAINLDFGFRIYKNYGKYIGYIM
jgi:hypothetical protein